MADLTLLNDPISPESFSVFVPVHFFFFYLRHFVGNYNRSQKSGAERPSNWRGATLQAIHHLTAACLSYSFLCLSPSLSTTLFLFLLKKKKARCLPLSLPPCKLLICLPPMLSSLGLLSNPGAESCGSVLAYGYLTSASPLIRLSSLNDATCGATNATEKSIKAFH